MAEQDEDQKTEHPTSKRLDDARDRGEVPISREFSNWISFVAIYIVVMWLGPKMLTQLFGMLRLYLEMPRPSGLDDRGLQTLILDMFIQVGFITFLVFAVFLVFGVLGTMWQTGFMVNTQRLSFDIKRILPMDGLKRLFSPGAAGAELAKSFGKLVVLGGIVFIELRPIVLDTNAIAGLTLTQGMALLHEKAIHLIIVLLLAYGIIALADFKYQKFQYIKNLRMTKTEVKDEFRQSEGDPKVKARLRQIRLEKARRRMMAQVPKADVIITNPTHYAVALKYDNKKMSAPVVVAKGINLIAEKIKEIAEENLIPAISNPPLARTLYDTVEIDQVIPTQHYRAVAQIISYVYKLKNKKF